LELEVEDTCVKTKKGRYWKIYVAYLDMLITGCPNV
jgi:hypothetical protein